MCPKTAKRSALSVIAMIALVLLILGAGVYRYITRIGQKAEMSSAGRANPRPVIESVKAAVINPRLTADQCFNRIRHIGETLESFSIENNYFPTAAEYAVLIKDDTLARCPADNSLYGYIPNAVRVELNGHITFSRPEPGKEQPITAYVVRCNVHSEANGVQVFCTEIGTEKHTY